MKQATLTQRLFYRIMPMILVAIALIGGLAFISAREEISYAYDAQLIDNANILWVLVQSELNEINNFDKKQVDIDFKGNQLSLNSNVNDYANDRMFRIWKSGKIVMLSDTALPEAIAMQKPGFATVDYKGEPWRIYTLEIAKKDISIEVGEKLGLRDDFSANILGDLILPLFILIPVIGILFWFGINDGLRVIRLLGNQIKQRSPDDLSPVETKSLPVDLLPLGLALNQLFGKLSHSLDAERRFADQAAHALRTPLAGLKLQIQMLAEADDAEQKLIIDGLMSSNERAARLVNKLLIAARISHQPLKSETLFLYHVIASVVAGLGVLIGQKQLDVSLRGDEDAQIKTDETLLQIMLTNLVENAVKFTPAGGRIAIQLIPAEDFWHIVIEDNGPGIAPDQREAAFEKFARLENSAEEGSGLGLSIVAEIIERLGGKIVLADPPGGRGLSVSVYLRRTAL